MRNLRQWLFAAIAACMSATLVWGLPAPPDDDDDKSPGEVSMSAAAPAPQMALEAIMVTGMRVRQGGAQDANFFRGEVGQNRIPHPDSLTAEGLMGDHDIALGQGTAACPQLFCLTAESARADLIALPEARYLVGLGFTSNIDPKHWHRQPVNLVAVVDKSGSMNGPPLELVRQSLREVLKQLGPEDQLSIVLYGDRAHVHLSPTPVTPDARRSIAAAIGGIVSEGSTAMETGLRLGYQLAAESGTGFRGTTRLMLFTDEQPNVGATDANSFMSMAVEASHRGIGLTTVGVGIQFGAALATRISSVRGGNLYFIRDEEDVESIYKEQLDYMVSELAYDLRLTIRPHAGYRIAGVYGVPGELLGWQGQDSVELKIPTVFLSNKGGAIFFSLVPDAAFLPPARVSDDEVIAAAQVEYLPPGASTTARHSVDVPMSSATVSSGMQLGRTLIDEFLVVHKAVSAHYLQNDQQTAFQLVHAFARRLNAMKDPALDSERPLVNTLDEQFTFLSGHSSEGAKRSNFVHLWGRWEVTRASGKSDWARGDIFEFTADNQFRVTYAHPHGDRALDEEEYRYSNEQVMLVDSEYVFDYQVQGSHLVLRRPHSTARLDLKRLP